ncbi:MAG: response receiver-modulated diguanylate cyclase [Deltaproteobacteria bacterium]|nr:response receiver-modulated diguanylate cyclase [Deltaproteobacteria bacterium]
MSEQTILIVDDSPYFRAVVKDAVLESGLFSNIIEAGDGAEALTLFVTNKVTFIITDVVMPVIDGCKLVAAIRAMEKGSDIPVIMLTANKQELSDKIKGFTLGASDYLVKPFDKGELIVRIKTLLKMHGLQEELKARNVLLERIATTDELTGLPNRRHFFDTARTIVALAKRNDLPIACLMIDMDFFKKINDTYGHQAGDMVLKRVAEVMLKNKREGELLARFGGEEFVIQLDESKAIFVTISAGCSALAGDSLTDIDKLIAMADEALYSAKNNGRNRVEMYSAMRPDHVDKKPFDVQESAYEI